MKIQKVTIKKFKVIKDLEKEINGANLLLIGDNGVGKSSFMQFIEIALGRTDNIPPNAFGEGEIIANRNGEEFRFIVKMKDGKPKVTVIAPNGLKDDRKSALAAIVGAIDFDINEFVAMSETVPGRRKQVEIYKSLLPYEVVTELNKFEANIRVTGEERTENNRKIKMLKGFLKESDLYGAHLKITSVDISDLNAQLMKANEVNNKITQVQQKVKTCQDDNARLQVEQDELLRRIEANKIKMMENDVNLSKANAWYLEPQNQPVDTAGIMSQIEASSEQNKKFAEAQAIIEKEKQVADLEAEVGEQTALIDSYKEAIVNAIREMESPVAGLGFDEDGLIYNDIPVSKSSLSTSEIIHLGCRLKMAQNNEFGVLLIEKGESLGTDRLNEIKAMADSQGWQIIMEQVERGTKELRFEFMTP